MRRPENEIKKGELKENKNYHFTSKVYSSFIHSFCNWDGEASGRVVVAEWDGDNGEGGGSREIVFESWESPSSNNFNSSFLAEKKTFYPLFGLRRKRGTRWGGKENL